MTYQLVNYFFSPKTEDTCLTRRETERWKRNKDMCWEDMKCSQKTMRCVV